jgi:hypothetical protein
VGGARLLHGWKGDVLTEFLRVNLSESSHLYHQDGWFVLITLTC